MSKVYLYSTLSNSQSVVVYGAYPGSNGGSNNKGSSKPSVREGVIYINGGANVIDHALVTPKGVVTEIEQAELEALRKVSCFKRWEEKGFITVENHDVDADEVAKDLTEKDGCAQTTLKEHDDRFDSGETSADVQVDEPKRKRAPKKRAPKKPADKDSADKE